MTSIIIIVYEKVGASTAIVIALPAGSQAGNDISFERLFYQGTIQFSTVQHETIIISNYDGVNVLPYGQYASLFVASIIHGEVIIRAANEILTLPDEVTRVVLELHAGDARAVLLLTVIESEVPVLPIVTFGSDVYVLSVEAKQTGLIGMVLATAENKEDVTYSLNINDEHLLARISINQQGELHLFAPANSGVYEFQVIATTVRSLATGTAKVHMTVQVISIEDDRIYVPPLIILNRNEEEPHNSLVSLPPGAEGCQFTLNNRWPLNQGWLYVDENGLHTTSIDREHESIAFMALSQIQVELILTCDSDNVSLKKRSKRSSWLKPYDYNANTWILTESIPYNPKRSLVNLIVEDINDNYPIFVGKENEPIAVGYPVYDLEERILPRSLAELQATDADIGENAALMYWSPEEALAVSPTTGFVHVRTGAQLQNNQNLTVYATDRRGNGLTGNLQILVKLLSADNIAVVTVGNAFLDNETSILTELSTAIGYELRVLRSDVISDTQNQNMISRNTLEMSASGASLLLYVYGLVDGEPVSVNRLTEDINENAAVASVINILSLEDHLVPVEIIVPERDIGFFVATIVLGVLLVLIIALTTILLCLKRRKTKDYDEFSDKKSLTSRTDSIDQVSKPETPKSRLNIEELKKSEQRLQDRLNTPIETVSVETITPKKETSIEDIADLLSPDSNIPIVIQSVDKLKDAEETDDDEFGEKVGARRKSVVTFNENVEKIIHLQNDTDSVDSTSVGYEVFKL
ncbi:unnamed protein product [Arctia plantaginis]|uniref:Cadherin domain-containing protein n=1 Tax=Arctia plantaginis TaxID=874455 RepID=A0A8S0YPT4_ARCPL|nr:unnamed protein product [Arctia plantaginis]